MLICCSSVFALVYGYLISCSKASNSGVEKNSPRVMPKPSQSFLRVTTPGFLLSPFRILLTVACGTARCPTYGELLYGV